MRGTMGLLGTAKGKVICQGMTGRSGTFHTQNMLDYGTPIVGGVNPKKGGTTHLGLPIFATVSQAIKATGACVSIIFVPAPFALSAIKEAASGGIKLIVCITEGVPFKDMLEAKELLDEHSIYFVGPNTPGLQIPRITNLGIIPSSIFACNNGPKVAIFSRSGTLAYEATFQISNMGLSHSICLGIGGDVIKGVGFVDCLKEVEVIDSDAILFIGEIGGCEEEALANELMSKNLNIPIFAYIAGTSAPKAQKMGHAGAIINRHETAEHKKKLLRQAGVHVIDSPLNIGRQVNAGLAYTLTAHKQVFVFT